MPIPFAPLVGWLLGMGIAWAGHSVIAKDDAPLMTTRPFLIVSLFAALVFAPVATYFVAFHPDWSYAYFFRREQIPSAIDLALVILSGASVILGFALAVRFLHRPRWLALLPIAPACIVIALAIATARRLAWSGTYAQFHGDFGLEPIGASALARGLVVGWIAIALGLMWTVRELRREPLT
jgi:hypothetical protein